MRDTNYEMFLTSYNNGWEKSYTWYKVEESVFNMDWTSICNSIPTTRITGLTDLHFQDYLQNNNIYYLHMGNIGNDSMMGYVNSNSHNKAHCKIIEHSNIGNY